jgi:hypothetical protein
MRTLIIFWIVGLAILSAFASARTPSGRAAIEPDAAHFKITLSDGRVLRMPL